MAASYRCRESRATKSDRRNFAGGFEWPADAVAKSCLIHRLCAKIVCAALFDLSATCLRVGFNQGDFCQI